MNPAELGQVYSVIKGKTFRFGNPYYAEQDKDYSTNECLLESVPIKTESNSISDYVSYREARKRLIQNGERYFECKKEETRRIREFHEKIFEEDSKRPKYYPY